MANARGFVEEDMREVGRVIAGVLGEGFGFWRGALLGCNRALMDKYLLYPRPGALLR